jgi:hypothetical protein
LLYYPEDLALARKFHLKEYREARELDHFFIDTQEVSSYTVFTKRWIQFIKLFGGGIWNQDENFSRWQAVRIKLAGSFFASS